MRGLSQLGVVCVCMGGWPCRAVVGNKNSRTEMIGMDLNIISGRMIEEF